MFRVWELNWLKKCLPIFFLTIFAEIKIINCGNMKLNATERSHAITVAQTAYIALFVFGHENLHAFS